MTSLPTFEEAVRFHGHACPGLAIGYRVATTAMDLLDVKRPYDEELVAAVENDTCAVDAIQVVTGCTFGKGNLIFKDYGKGGFSFFSREKGKAFRISYRGFPSLSGAEGARMEKLRAKAHQNVLTDAERKEMAKLRQKLMERILDAPPDELFKRQQLDEQPPSPARIHASIVCERCGEQVMDTRVRRVSGQSLCIPCAEMVSRKE